MNPWHQFQIQFSKFTMVHVLKEFGRIKSWNVIIYIYIILFLLRSHFLLLWKILLPLYEYLVWSFIFFLLECILLYFLILFTCILGHFLMDSYFQIFLCLSLYLQFFFFYFCCILGHILVDYINPYSWPF